jgi:hypothetical protein
MFGAFNVSIVSAGQANRQCCSNRNIPRLIQIPYNEHWIDSRDIVAGFEQRTWERTYGYVPGWWLSNETCDLFEEGRKKGMRPEVGLFEYGREDGFVV